MNRSKAKVRAKALSQRELEGLEEDKREIESSLREAESFGKGTAAEQVDKGRMKSEIKKISETIDLGTPMSVRGDNKDKLIKEEAELEKEIAVGMPTWYEMRQPTKNPGAVRKHMDWCKRNKVRIGRYKQLQRVLNFSAPKSIENLRKES